MVTFQFPDFQRAVIVKILNLVHATFKLSSNLSMYKNN